MDSRSRAGSAWRDFREALCLGEPRARLRLLASVTSLVSYAGRSLEPDTRADVCERIVVRLAAQIRAQTLRSPAELLHALDAELAGWLSRVELDALAPSTVLLARLGVSLRALPEAQRRALAAYYGLADSAPADSPLRHQALAELRGHLAIDAH